MVMVDVTDAVRAALAITSLIQNFFRVQKLEYSDMDAFLNRDRIDTMELVTTQMGISDVCCMDIHSFVRIAKYLSSKAPPANKKKEEVELREQWESKRIESRRK